MNDKDEVMKLRVAWQRQQAWLIPKKCEELMDAISTKDNITFVGEADIIWVTKTNHFNLKRVSLKCNTVGL